MKAKTVALFAIPAILVLGAPFLGSKVLTYMSEREWSAVETEAKAVELPLTPEEALKDYRPGPDEQNAAEGAKAVLRMVMNPPKADSANEFMGGFKPEYKTASTNMSKRLKDFFQAGTKPKWESLRKSVDKFEAPLQRLEQEVKKPSWNFKRNWSQGMALLLPDGATLKQLSQMFHARALLAMHDGDFPKAIASIQAIIRLGRHMQTEPSIIIVLVGMSCEAMGYQAALDLARIRPLTPNQIRDLSTVLTLKPPEIDWRRIWRNEYAGSVASMDLFLTEKGLRDLGLKDGDGYPVYSRRKYLTEKSKIVRLMIAAEREWQQNPTNQEAAVRVAQKYADPLQEAFAHYSDIFAMLSSGGSADGPIVGTVATLKRLQTIRQLTNLAIPLTAQPASKWVGPASDPNGLWTDPYSGKPLVLPRTGNGFKLYSVGVNGVDDGGKTDRDANEDTLDIVVSFPSR